MHFASLTEVHFQINVYRVFRSRADWTLTHTSHKDTEQSTTQVSITPDGVTMTDSLIRSSPFVALTTAVYLSTNSTYA
jgi:hypothetical protein